MPKARERSPLTRMRVLMLVTLLSTIGMVVALTTMARDTQGEQVASALTAAPVLVLAWFWEGRPPWWAALLGVGPAYAWWVVSAASGDGVLSVVPAALALGLASMHLTRKRLLADACLFVVSVVPAAFGAILHPSLPWMPWLVVTIACVLTVIGIVELSRLGWLLTLQLEDARQVEREIATVQERYRLASELHDIQGHTLHVARMTIQLARRLLDDDPGAAATHLASAESMIGDTLVETRQIIAAEREVTVWRELANARSITEAAGIEWRIDGDPDECDHELFALLIREATTNQLRHAHSTTVSVRMRRRAMSISNDGAEATIGPLGGLAVLARRFEGAGGTLTTTLDAGVFEVTGRLP